MDAQDEKLIIIIINKKDNQKKKKKMNTNKRAPEKKKFRPEGYFGHSSGEEYAYAASNKMCTLWHSGSSG